MASMTLKQIDASIKSIVRRGKALREDAHKTLVAIIEHHIEHGDYTKLALLHNAVKGSLGSSIGQALVQWVNDYYNGITWDKEAGAFVHVKGVDKAIKADVSYKSKDGTFTHEGDARGLPFYRLEKPVNQAPFDLKARILMLVTQAENARTKAIKEGKDAPVTKAALEAIKALSESYDSLKDEEPASKEAEETAKTLAVADQMKAEGEAKVEEAAPAPVVNKRKAAKAA